MSVVDVETGEVIVPLTKTQARRLTDDIKTTAGQLWVLLSEAHNRRAWAALGYDRWEDYVRVEFDMSRSRSYQILTQAEVVKAVAAAAGVVSTNVDISEGAARDLKPHLSAVLDEIEGAVEEIEKNPKPAPDAVETAIQRTLNNYREQAKQAAAEAAKKQQDREEFGEFVRQHTPDDYGPAEKAADERAISVRQSFIAAMDELLGLDVDEVIASMRPYLFDHVAKVRPVIDWLTDFETKWESRDVEPS